MLDKDAVRKRLAKLGIEAQEAARRMGKPKQAFWNIMAGGGNVTLETLNALAKALECEPCDLLQTKRRKGPSK